MQERPTGDHVAPVLLVEDDPQVRQIVQWALEDEGLEVEAVGDGQLAVEAASRRRPSAVVLDWTLPRLNADGVADALRATYGPELPLVLITADGRSAEKAERVGAAVYFHKPFDIEELVEAVRAAMRRG